MNFGDALDFEDQLEEFGAGSGEPEVQIIEFRERPGEQFYLEIDPHEVWEPGDALESDELGIFGTIKKIATAPLSLARRVATPITTAVGGTLGGAIGGQKGRQIGARIGRAAATLGTAGAVAPLLASSPSLALTAAAAPTIGRMLKSQVAPLVKRLGAQPVADAMAAQAVRQVATPGCVEPHLARVSVDISKRLMEPLKRMEKELSYARSQREATSEHHALVGQKGFRADVLQRLRRIEQRLPSNHPARPKVRRAISRQMTLGRRAYDLGYR